MKDILNYLNDAYATPDREVETDPKGGDGAIGKIREALRTRPSLLTVLVMLSALAAVSGCGGGEEDDGEITVERRIVAFGTEKDPISFIFRPGGCDVKAQNNDDEAGVLDTIVKCGEGDRINVIARDAFCVEVEGNDDGNPRIAQMDTTEFDDGGEAEARRAETSKSCVGKQGGEIGIVVNF